MSKEELEKLFVRSFEDLNIDILNVIDANIFYSYKTKSEFLKFVGRCQWNLKIRGLKSLKSYKSKCPACYPNSNAYSFYDKVTNNFIIKYVVHQNSSDSYIIDECKNNPIPDSENGLPF